MEHDDPIRELKGKLQLVLISFVWLLFLLFVSMQFKLHSYFLNPCPQPFFYILGGCPLFWRGKWCIYIQNLNAQIQQHFRLLHNYIFINIFYIIVLVMIIITAAVIFTKKKKLDYIWLTSALPLIIDDEVLSYLYLT